MKKKKGFIFLETIVVMTVLTTSLILIYSSFNSVVIEEKRRRHYDNSEYVYKTYAIMDYLKTNDEFKKDYQTLISANNGNHDSANRILMINDFETESHDVNLQKKKYSNYDNNQDVLSIMVNSYRIKGIYLFNDINRAKNDVNLFKNPDMSAYVIDYIKTISNIDNECYVVILFREDTSDDTSYQLASFVTNGLMESGK